MLARTLAEPDLVGAARALVFGTSSARALVVQVSAFDGREHEALSRVQKLFERLSSGGVLTAAEIESAVARQRHVRRLAALDPRYRLVQLLEPAVRPSSTRPRCVGSRRACAQKWRSSPGRLRAPYRQPRGKTPTSR